MFEYNVRAPLDVEELSPPWDRDGVTVHDVAYASPRGGKVTAYLVEPEGNGPFAGVLFLHPGQWDRSSFLDEAVAFARIGAVTMSVDGPNKRPCGFAPRYPRTAEGYRARWTHMIVDLRRSLDLLVSRLDVDPDRIGYVGHSYGATLGGVLAGIEERVHAYVLMAGLASHSEWWRVSESESARRFRARRTGTELDALVETMAAIDAIHFIGKAAPAKLLFQFAHHDAVISERNALQYWQAASEPKEIRWYDTDHFFDERARQERLAWLGERLGLSAA